jgi:signal peptidase II
LKKAFFKLLPYFLGLFILKLDADTKRYALETLPKVFNDNFPYGGVAVFKDFLGGIDFSLNYVQNKGAAWGIFSDYPNLLAYVRIVIVLFLFFLIAKASFRFIQKCALSFIVFGALGNLIDHFRYGFVIDLFHFNFFGYDFPVFNVADAAIFCGVVVLLLTKNKKHD